MFTLVSFDVLRNPPPRLADGFRSRSIAWVVAPVIARRGAAREITGQIGKFLKQRDQHGDDHVIAAGHIEAHRDETLPVVIEERAKLDSIRTFRCDDYVCHVHVSLSSGRVGQPDVAPDVAEAGGGATAPGGGACGGAAA